jgi:hypothetical protein
MSELTLAQLLDQLQLHLAKDLLKRIQDGTASASELNVARQLLKDNHVDVPKTDPHLAALAAAASHVDEDDIAGGLTH